MRKWVVSIVCFFVFCATAAGQPEVSIVPHQYIIQLHATHSIVDAGLGSEIAVEPIAPAMQVFLLTIKNDSENTLQELQKNKAIRIAQRNHSIATRAVFTPNDPFFSTQWNLNNTGQTGTIGTDVDAPEAWAISHQNITATGDTIVIAILENGMDLLHEDIHIFYNYNEIPGDNIDNDNNGYIDDYNGWDISLDKNYVSGNNAHAIHVAGIAAAVGDNGKGIAGICMGAKVLPITYGSGNVESDVVKAYNYVLAMRKMYDTTNGAKGAFIVATNSSFGIGAYGANPSSAPIWCAMYDSLGKYGILNAVSAPNANVDVDVVHDVPSECPSDFVISATNTTATDIRYGSGAAWGKKSIDIGAPGSGIYSLYPSNGYNYLSGTSMAAPHIAGAVGACYGMACHSFMQHYKNNPSQYAQYVKNAILIGATRNYSLEHRSVSDGRLNLYQSFLKMQEFDCDSCGFSAAVYQKKLICKNDSNATLSAYPKGMSYLWNNGNPFDSLAQLKSGTYIVTITDNSGCRMQLSAFIYNPKEIKINAINSNPVTSVANGNITANITSGNDTMQYSIGGAFQTSNLFTIATSGYYTLTARNQSGCETDTLVFVDFVNGISTENSTAFAVYPNPASDYIYIAYDPSVAVPEKVQITDLSGKIIFELSPPPPHTAIATDRLPVGCYLLSCVNSQNRLFSRPLLIVRQSK